MDTPSVARIYDYLLGGSHNFSADRELAKKAITVMPDLRLQAQQNRAFLRRVIQYMLRMGVRQFLDIGSGILTVGNVHEIVQGVAPDSRVVYVDIDSVAVAHGELMLVGNSRTTIIREDLRHTAGILRHPRTQALMNFDQPVGVLLLGVIHAIPDQDDPPAIAAKLRDAVSPGSYLAIAHATTENRPDEVREVARLIRQTTTPITPRSRPQIEGLFAGLHLIEPGVVWAPLWHPDSSNNLSQYRQCSINLVGLGRKP